MSGYTSDPMKDFQPANAKVTSGSGAYKGGGTQAERRAYWAAFWEAEAIKSEIRLKWLQGVAAQVIPDNIPLSEVMPPSTAAEVQKVASTGYVRSKLAAVDPHHFDRCAGMRPMSGTYTTERTTKRWAAGEFPRKAMR